MKKELVLSAYKARSVGKSKCSAGKSCGILKFSTATTLDPLKFKGVLYRVKEQK